MREFQFIYQCTTIYALILMPSVCTIPIPFMPDVTFVPRTPINSTILHNVTCDECLCQTVPSHAILNCFPNSSCQFFLTTPRRYRLVSSLQARLFFPNGQLPNKSECCMPNTTELINKLQNGTRITVSTDHPRCLSLKNPDEIYTVDRSTGQFRGFSANNLTNILSVHLSVNDPISLTQNGGHSYISRESNSIIIFNDNSGTTVGEILYASFNAARDILFLNSGKIMVVASTYGQSLVFFTRMNNSPVNYTFFFNQVFPSVFPHGLFYINDSFFYASSWSNNRIYSFTAVNSTFWQEKLIADASAFLPSDGGAHVTVDECGRLWFALSGAGIVIFDDQGNILGRFFPPSMGNTFHVAITDNYVLFVSGTGPGQILRIDPGIQC